MLLNVDFDVLKSVIDRCLKSFPDGKHSLKICFKFLKACLNFYQINNDGLNTLRQVQSDTVKLSGWY
ncbi:hypothetical protein ASG31_08515 [Chryseobacterium sp. Leaf404]|nr:hypothetical protein ASG31_08515 [Chryseobacterium sp. Leaf404]